MESWDFFYKYWTDFSGLGLLRITVPQNAIILKSDF